MKKLFKILGVALLIILLLLLASPFLFQNQIKNTVKTFLNNNVNVQVDFADVSLSLLKNFPQATVTVDQLSVINYKPFEGDTLATAKSISFNMSVKELFKKASDGPIVIKSFDVDEALLTLKTNKFGNDNYDITKETDRISAQNTSDKSFKLNVENYSIKNSVITYFDESSRMALDITELNHSGKGIFSAHISELNTKSQANVSLSIDSTRYLNNNSVKLDALIDLNLNENKYTFKENKGLVNQLPLEFNGYVKMLDEGQEIDISFKNPGSSFKDFLAVIPQEYSKDLENVKTSGNFKVSGLIKGLNTDTTIPKFDISVLSDDASFKYPNLSKSVENITINTNIKNDSGITEDTYVNINALNFKIDQDVFKSSAKIKNLTKNMLVDANIEGTLNLANITKAYPVKLENELSGILKGKLHTIFDMNAIETNAYEHIKNNGNVFITDFIFSSEDIVNPINISKANMQFQPGSVMLNSFKATTGKSDLTASGTLYNLLGFLLSDNKLQGIFNVDSNTFLVSDFMVEGSKNSKETKTNESLKIPAFLDCSINAYAKTVLYDNLILKDVKGKVVLKNEQATLENMTSSLFDGKLALSGNVSTKTNTPVFNLDLIANKFDISKSFNGMDLFQNLTPIAKALQGKLNSSININGTLNSEFSPNLNSISGNAFAELLTAKIEPKNIVLFDQLKGALSFVDFDKLDLNDVKTKLSFENGIVTVKPFNLKYKDIIITVDGSHSFDKTMSYKAVFDVPAKYLGSNINNLISKIDEKAVNDIKIPVTATIGGTFTNPKVTTDLTSGVTNLTKQLLEIEKNKLINKGKDQLKDLVGGVLVENPNPNDTTLTKTKDPVKKVLSDIMGNTQKQKDTLKTNQKNQVKDILSGILDGKKKRRDSVN